METLKPFLNKCAEKKYPIARILQMIEKHPGLCPEAWENVARKLETTSLSEVERWLDEDVEPIIATDVKTIIDLPITNY